MQRPWAPTQALSARTAQYMRARGKDVRPQSTTGPAPVPHQSRAEARQHGAPPPGASPPFARRVEKTAPAPELLIPYSVSDDNHLVHAREADTAGSYKCPGCMAPLVLHAGAVRARHFSHKGNTVCDGETLVHITTKLLIAKVINDHRSSNFRITLHCTCSRCQSSVQKVMPCTAFTGSAVEERVGAFICDVVAFRESAPVLGIEILNAHAVDAVKAERLDIPWIELAAADVLENPLDWRPVQMRLKPMVCADCKNERAELERVAERWKLPLSEPLYVPAVAPCWSCKEKIIWHWWRGVPFAQTRPPEPVPRTLQFRFSKMYGGKYWMNVCPGCRAPQGDNFVFLASDSPFTGLSLNETGEMRAHQQRGNAAVVTQFVNIIKGNMGCK